MGILYFVLKMWRILSGEPWKPGEGKRRQGWNAAKPGQETARAAVRMIQKPQKERMDIYSIRRE